MDEPIPQPVTGFGHRSTHAHGISIDLTITGLANIEALIEAACRSGNEVLGALAREARRMLDAEMHEQQQWEADQLEQAARPPLALAAGANGTHIVGHTKLGPLWNSKVLHAAEITTDPLRSVCNRRLMALDHGGLQTFEQLIEDDGGQSWQRPCQRCRSTIEERSIEVVEREASAAHHLIAETLDRQVRALRESNRIRRERKEMA